jgi:uncharacterized membrane-anchored protein
MERHYAVWSAYCFTVAGIIVTLVLVSWFRTYVERTRINNPTKAALVSFLFFLSWVLVLIGVRIFIPADQNILGIDNVLREVALAGIIFLSFFTALFGFAYVLRVKFHKRFI